MNTAEHAQDTPEVTHLLEKMREEYELAQSALTYFRPGKRTDAFVAARHEAVTLAHLRLGWLIGREQATHAVCRFFRDQIEREEAGDEQNWLAYTMILDNTWLSLILVAYRLHHDQIVQPIAYPPSDEITTRLTQVLSPVFTELCQYLGVRGAQQRLQAMLDIQAPGQTDAQFSLGRALALTQLKTLKIFRQVQFPDPTAGDALLLRILKEYRGVHEVARHLPFEPETTEAQSAAKQAKQAFLEERFQAATDLHLQLARLVGLQPAAKMTCAFLADKVNLDLTIPNLWLSPILAA